MKVPFLDLQRETQEVHGELTAAVAATLDESRFVGGAAVADFERAFAASCGAAHAIGVASGTDAVALALSAVGVAAGDEVVTAANTCVPTVAAIERAGAVPVLADVDARSFTLDVASVEAALTPRTRALVAVHLYGQCADMTPLVQLARERGLRVVEDAAQAHGAAYEGRPAGTLGDAAAFSFYPTKNLGAIGDAGAVVTADADVAARVRLLRNYGESERGVSVASGSNSRLDTVQAAALLVKQPKVRAWNARRRALAAAYRDRLADTAAVVPEELPGRTHAWHLYVVRVRDRDAVRRALAARGVETLVHYPRPVHRQPAYAALARHLPVSESVAREVLSLPLYPQLTDDEHDRVCVAFAEACR